jgi:hypothetical protein
MPETKSPLRFMAWMLATAAAFLILLSMLPDNRYLRFQSLTDPAVVKAGWIYERLRFDPSPIDVVFIGTSHTVFGINSDEVEHACRNARGKNCATVNFALQHLGRDLHWILAREAMELRAPKLLIIEIQENESRAMHPAFPFLANAADIVAAPAIINTSYFDDLVRLPLRQMMGFAKASAPGLFGVRTQFDPRLYRGSHWDDTYSEKGSIEHPMSQPVPRTAIHTTAELEKERVHLQALEGATRKLPAPFRQVEYRASLLYLEKTVQFAREKGIQVRFLYMPTFRGKSSAEFHDFYERLAPVWQMPSQISGSQEMWLDIGHLNTMGADSISKWLGRKIATEAIGQDQPAASNSCSATSSASVPRSRALPCR